MFFPGYHIHQACSYLIHSVCTLLRRIWRVFHFCLYFYLLGPLIAAPFKMKVIIDIIASHFPSVNIKMKYYNFFLQFLLIMAASLRRLIFDQN